MRKSYLAMANGNFDVNITHRYRFIIPLLARIIAACLNFLLLNHSNHKLPLGFGFLIVNTSLMAIVCLYIYKIVSIYSANNIHKIIAVLSILTSSYCGYITGLALVDSLYILMVIILFYALLTNNHFCLFIAIIIGPLAKESFFLFFPFILMYGRFISWYSLFLYLIMAVTLFIGAQYLVDVLFYNASVSNRLNNSMFHSVNIFSTLQKLISPAGFMAYLSTFGLFNLLILVGFFKKTYKMESQENTIMFSLFLGIVFIHILLSGDIGRMWYLAAPVFAIGIVKALDKMDFNLS